MKIEMMMLLKTNDLFLPSVVDLTTVLLLLHFHVEENINCDQRCVSQMQTQTSTEIVLHWSCKRKRKTLFNCLTSRPQVHSYLTS
jgi:hypothetical protein